MIGDGEYSGWKGWTAERFGEVAPHEAAYFRRELRDARLRPGAAVLEMGFGNGAFLAFARAAGYEVRGTEINAAQLAAARERGFEAFHPDELDERLAGRRFDLVVAFDVLEHVAADELPATLRRVRDLLAPGGHFIARFPNGQSPFGLAIQHGDVTHRTAIGAGMVRQLARAARLEVVSVRDPRIMLHANPAIAAIRCARWVAARAVEACVGAVFYSRIEPLSPNLVAHLRRPPAEEDPR